MVCEGVYPRGCPCLDDVDQPLVARSTASLIISFTEVISQSLPGVMSEYQTGLQPALRVVVLVMARPYGRN